MEQLWFDRPANEWNEALPIGNGRMGAMVSGGIYKEKLQLNQDSIYNAGPTNRLNPDAKEHLDEVRTLILAGKIREAEKKLKYCFSGIPVRPRMYQPLGKVDFTYSINGKTALPGDSFETKEYSRRLDLNCSIVTESFIVDGCKVIKEYLASYPHGIIAMTIEAQNGKISLDATLNRGHNYDHGGKLDNRTIFMDGSSGKNGVCWMTALRAQAEGGNVFTLGEHLIINDAEKIYLYLGCETSFYEEDYARVLQNKLDVAERVGYKSLREEHIKDYQELYNRVTLSVEDDTDLQKLIPTDKLLALGKENGFDSAFVSLYFQYGRYLMISSSRPGSLASNLQGIWNDSFSPGWGSRYTININTQMNYWPAEMCGLSECHMPLFDLMLRMWNNGKEAAEKMYGCRGFVAHHNTDLWGDCAPNGTWMPGTYWVMGGAWLCTHIWQHYLYTHDKEFLQKMYPIMKDSVLFFHDFLIEVDGQLLICPSVSPENTYILPDGTRGCIEAGTTMDNEILRDLLECYLKASDVLDIQEEEIEITKKILTKLPPIEIGKHGQIMEWRKDYDEAEPGHRHISHLYGLHPSHQITVDKTPELAKAADKTLERRLTYGGGHTGWSCAWIINFYTRLGKGDAALDNLYKLWHKSTFPNLMDTHPVGKDGFVFQIDGNFGATAAIAEMLIQSDEDRVLLLPALPQKWKHGKITGITVPGGAKVDLTWRDGKLLQCQIKSERDMKLTVVYGEIRKQVNLKAGEPVKF